MSANPPSGETLSCIHLCSQLGSHVPSFKNSKMLTRGRLITKPENQKWMELCVQNFTSQLLFSYPMQENETVTAEKLRSWIASVMPANDSCRYLRKCCWEFSNVPVGLEGASIEVTRVK